jgi:hypothetical protein
MKWLIALLFFGLIATASARERFRDARHGISFRYPHGYVLKDEILSVDDAGLSFLEAIPLEFSVPGGSRIATVEMPSGSYPGTDFEDAFFTVGVHQHLTEEQCAQFPDHGYPQTVYSKTIDGFLFRGVKIAGAAAGHQDFGKSYRGYFDGECIALGYVLATGGYGDVENLKRAPYKSIEARLDAILESVRIRPPNQHVASSLPSILNPGHAAR